MRLLVSRAARAGRALTVLSLALAIGACSNDTTAPEPLVPVTATFTADAATATAFVALGTQPRAVAASDSTSATSWDIAFNATNVKLNTAGGVTAYCLCSNQTATDAAVMAMTATAQLSTFEQVSATAIPTDASFTADMFTAKKWYRYNLTGADHQIWPTFDVYLVKRGSTVYKVQVTNYYGATGTARQITIRSALIRS
jgi:hypothetical protein